MTLFAIAATITLLSWQGLPVAYEVERITEGAPAVDGSLSDPAWETASWADDFQNQGGAPVGMTTAFALLYDSEFLYMAVRLNDADPEMINRVEGERDDVNGDRIGVFFDTTLDAQSSFVFVVNAAGVIRDQLGEGNNGPWQDDWNVDWTSAAAVHDGGWAAEFRIPLEVLGGTPSEGDEWGLQLARGGDRIEAPLTWRPIVQLRGWTGSFGRIVFG